MPINTSDPYNTINEFLKDVYGSGLFMYQLNDEMLVMSVILGKGIPAPSEKLVKKRRGTQDRGRTLGDLLDGIRTPDFIDVSGRRLVFVVQSGSGAGVATVPEGGNLPRVNDPIGRNPAYDTARIWARIRLTENELDLGTSDIAQFIPILALKVRDITSELVWEAGRQVYGDGTGTITTIPTGAANATQTVALAKYIHPGMRLAFYNMGPPVTRIGDRIVIDVDPDQNKITLNSSITTVNGTVIVRADSTADSTSTVNQPGNEMNGLLNIVSQTSTLGGIDPTVAGNGFWKAAYVNSTSEAVSEDVFARLRLAILNRTGYSPEYYLTTPEIEEAFAKLYTPNRRLTNEDRVINSGYIGVSYSGAPIYADPFCRPGTLFALNSDNLFFASRQKAGPNWKQGVDGKLLWDVQADANYAALSWSIQLATNRRNAFAMKSGLTTS
jgi:hypothetical protein